MRKGGPGRAGLLLSAIKVTGVQKSRCRPSAGAWVSAASPGCAPKSRGTAAASEPRRDSPNAQEMTLEGEEDASPFSCHQGM